MKKFIAAVLAAALIACPFTSALAKDTEISSSGRLGGVIIEQGASAENYLSESAVSFSEFPKSYSSVDMGYVTPVKNQGVQNTCIIFSGIAAMESALLKNGYGEYDLSEEYANYWASTRADGTGWQRDRVNTGAYPYTGYGCLTTGGVVLESEFPYMSRTEEYFEELEHTDPLFYAGGIKVLSGSDSSAENVKQTIMESGGVVASFAYFDEYLNSDTSSYFCGDSLTRSKISQGAHSVFVVGWDDNYSKENFARGGQPENDGAWLIKNSWGSSYSYIWISYEDKYLGSDLFGGIYAVNDIIKNHTCNELLTVDSYGTIYDMDFSGNYFNANEMTFINTFNFSTEMPSISNVEFSTSTNGADYKIYYIPTTNGVPVDDETLWVELTGGQIPYSGIHNISFKPYTVPDSQGAIGVKIIANDGTSASIGCCEWLGNLETSVFQLLPRTLDNRSFINSKGTTVSLTDYYSSQGDNIGGNFTIRAIANIQKGDVSKDGEISVADAILVQKDIASIINLDSDTAEYVADTSGDGKISVADAIIIQKIIANIIPA